MTHGDDLLLDPVFDMKLIERMENEMVIGLGIGVATLNGLLVIIMEDYEFCFVYNREIELKRDCYSCVMLVFYLVMQTLM